MSREIEGNFTGKPTASEATPVYGTSMVDLPTEDPMLWDAEQAASAEVCAGLFANEFLYDHSEQRALMRLGVEENRAALMGEAYLGHWLVQRKLKDAVLRFRERQIATEDSVMALLWQEAGNFGPNGHPLARAAAQKQLSKVLCMEPEDKRKATLGDDVQPGVMLVYHVDSAEEFERQALASQAKLKKEVGE